VISGSHKHNYITFISYVMEAAINYINVNRWYPKSVITDPHTYEINEQLKMTVFFNQLRTNLCTKNTEVLRRTTS